MHMGKCTEPSEPFTIVIFPQALSRLTVLELNTDPLGVHDNALNAKDEHDLFIDFLFL